MRNRLTRVNRFRGRSLSDGIQCNEVSIPVRYAVSSSRTGEDEHRKEEKVLNAEIPGLWSEMTSSTISTVFSSYYIRVELHKAGSFDGSR